MSVPDRGPDALLPVWAARLVGFAGLGSLAALEWQRLADGLSAGRALLWVAVATGAGAAVLACDLVEERWRGSATIAATAAGLLAAVAVSGIELELLKPRNWGELVDGVVGGTQSLGTVRMPYAGADPWPRAALELLGSWLLTISALVACWPRERGRGYPFLALIGLLVLVASPVVSLGGTRPLILGAALAALTVCFLWLERLPLRPGVGVAALLGLALAGALPLAAVADRGEPWFDYKAFAEGLGPDDPVRFSWNQEYGPIDWPRDGNEVMRIKSDEPHYWKAANLDEFDGRGWREAPVAAGADTDFSSEVREDWWNAPGWEEKIEVSVRRMRTRALVAPGTVMEVTNATRPVRATGPGRFEAEGELRRGDSYTANVYVPEPAADEVSEAAVSGFQSVRGEQLRVTVPFLADRRPTARQYGGNDYRLLREAVIQFRPFDDERLPYAEFPEIARSHRRGDRILERTVYRRTWRLAQQLRDGAETPYEYIVRVNTYLQDGFGYSERPAQPAAGRPPLDAFLIDTRVGYCQHFSGAMALLLRMGGVPARVATGFSPGGYSDRREAWIVRDTDAHAWVEVWFEGVGWVTYDPTPASTPARSQIAALEPPPDPAPPTPDAAVGGGEGTRDAAGRTGGVRPDLLLDNDPAFTDEAVGATGGGLPWWAWALAAAAVSGAAVLLLRRRRGAAGALSPLDRAIAELESALRRSGRPAPTGTTLRQLEQRLGGSPEATAYLRALSAGRYGPTTSVPTPAQRRALRRALAQGLGPVGRLRALWALPPRPR